MPEPLPLAASASSSACTSFRVRPTTSNRRSRSVSTPRALPRPERRSQLLQQTFVADHHQRLSRCLEQVEEFAALGARVDVLSIRQQLHASTATGRLEQPHAELLAQNPDEQMQLVDGKPTPPQFCQNQQLEEFNRRIAAFGVTTGVGQVRRDRRGDEPSLVPQLQLTRGQPRERRHFARTVGLLEAHASRFWFSPAYLVEAYARRLERLERTLLHLGILRDRRPICRTGERAMRHRSMVCVLS